jgi:Planctomycete cytochrome C
MVLRSDVISALAVVTAIGLAFQSDLGDERVAESVEFSTHQAVSFSEDVMPLFEKHCWECHSEESTELGLRLDSYEGLMLGSDYGTVIEPGDAAGSLLIDMVESGDMPEDGDPVPPEELEVIKTWIDEGAENN